MAKVSSPHRVVVVVDPEFGEKLAALPAGLAVWIVDTPANKPVAQRLWKERPEATQFTGITTFGGGSTSFPPEELFISMLDTIDLHHGRYSADPPYTILEVFGAKLTEGVRTALLELGFTEFDLRSSGFQAIRPLPSSE